MELPRGVIRDLEVHGFIDDEGLTNEAIKIMKLRENRVA
jgi:hypothetical protein